MAHVGDRQTAAAENGDGHTGEAKTHTFFLVLCLASVFAEIGKGRRGALVEGVERLRERGWATDTQGAGDAVESDAHDEVEPDDIGVHVVCELVDGVLEVDVAALERRGERDDVLGEGLAVLFFCGGLRLCAAVGCGGEGDDVGEGGAGGVGGEMLVAGEEGGREVGQCGVEVGREGRGGGGGDHLGRI